MKIGDKLRLIQSQPPKPSLGTLLKHAREALGMEQGAIAEELGVARQTVSNFENDHVVPPRGMVIAWCVITAADFDELDEAHRLVARNRHSGSRARRGGATGALSTGTVPQFRPASSLSSRGLRPFPNAG